jgi:ribosomal protein S18 acetylase RimI-like enzyme
MNIEYGNDIPTMEAFFQLYQTTGWNANGTYTEEALFKAINNSWYLISAYQNGELIGFGRIISDGVYQTFIGDLIVHPDHQNQGIGSTILRQLTARCKESGIKWIQLTCAKGKMDFYKKYGFEERPADGPGMQIYI